jgi:hypothetical protein
MSDLPRIVEGLRADARYEGALGSKKMAGEFKKAADLLEFDGAPPASGEIVAGIYRESVALTSGRFAMIDNGMGFALVLRTPDLERHRGQHVSGVAQDDGGIDWRFACKRGLEI